MLLPKLLNASDARKNFYQLLKQVAAGQEVFIENTDTGEKFQIVKTDPKPKADKLQLVEELGKVGLKTMPIEEMKPILNTTHDIKLP